MNDMDQKETKESGQDNMNDKKQTAGGRNKKTGLILLVIALLILVFIAVFFVRKNAEKAEEKTLSVALYPFVPDMERFENIITEKWKAEHPRASLEFVDWSCYDEDPPEDLDVFVLDSIYLTDFIEQGYLLPIPEKALREEADIVPFSMDGCRAGGELYAVPQILCTHLLYTRKADTELEDVSDIITLYEKIGDRELQTEIPEENDGLLIDLTGGTTKATMYLDAQIDENNAYTEYDDLPDQETFSEDTLDLLRLLRKMGGEAQVNYWPEDNDPYVRAKWFAEGKGRAMIAYSEALSNMPDYVDQVDFRTFSYSDRGGVPLYYADVAAINAKIDDDKKELAYDLIDILTSADTIVKASSPAKEDGAPQYLLPARLSAYDRLSESFPAYAGLKEIVTNPDNRIFRLGKNARVYIKNTKKVLPGLIFPQE